MVTTSQIEHSFVFNPDKGLRKLRRQAYPAEAAGTLAAERLRVPTPLAAFDAALAERNAQLAALDVPQLQPAELAAARLYTGPMYLKYNLVLRGSHADADVSWRQQLAVLCMGNPYTTTLHAINSAVSKLAKLTPAGKVYRGMARSVLPPSFTQENAFHVRGGIETAFMSTTTDRAVALSYAQDRGGGGAPGLTIEIQQGMVDRGASLGWLSQYPHEAEVPRRAHLNSSHPI
jgi:hypothetical protein